MIHPTAIISDKAQLGKRVSVGPYSVIGDLVEIKDDVIIGSHCSIGSHGAIREGNKPPGRIIIFNHTIIKDHVVIKYPEREERTAIGKCVMIMDFVNIAHDCVIGDNCIIGSGTKMGGVTTIHEDTRIGLNVTINNRISIGPCSMVGSGSVVVRNLGTYSKAKGVPARQYAVNVKGMKMTGYANKRIDEAIVRFKERTA